MQVRRVVGGGRSEQRQTLVEDDVEPTAENHPHLGLNRARVGRTHRERCRRAGRPGDRAERRAGAAVVPRRCDDERVEVERALHGLGLRPVREGGVRLGHADERDPHRIVLVAVAVRVDEAVEPRDQLVAPAVDKLTAVGSRLPAGDANRKHTRRRRDTAKASRARSNRRGCRRARCRAPRAATDPADLGARTLRCLGR